MINNVADEKQIKQAQLKERIIQKNDVTDLLYILSTVEGRRFIWKLLGKCKIYESTLHPSGSMVYYNEGRRAVGLELLSEIISADEDSYLKMMKESKKGLL